LAGSQAAAPNRLWRSSSQQRGKERPWLLIGLGLVTLSESLKARVGELAINQ